MNYTNYISKIGTIELKKEEEKLLKEWEHTLFRKPKDKFPFPNQLDKRLYFSGSYEECKIELEKIDSRIKNKFKINEFNNN